MNNNPLILIVEDDNHIKNLISTTLKVNKYNYLVATSGNEAIMLAVSHKPDIILLDLGLPDMDGVEIIKNPCASWWSDRRCYWRYPAHPPSNRRTYRTWN